MSRISQATQKILHGIKSPQTTTEFIDNYKICFWILQSSHTKSLLPWQNNNCLQEIKFSYKVSMISCNFYDFSVTFCDFLAIFGDCPERFFYRVFRFRASLKSQFKYYKNRTSYFCVNFLYLIEINTILFKISWNSLQSG